MSIEESYERVVTNLERIYAAQIKREAAWAITNYGPGDDPRDFAHDHVVSTLLDDEAWAPVKAADISDIALEAANEAAAHAWPGGEV